MVSHRDEDVFETVEAFFEGSIGSDYGYASGCDGDVSGSLAQLGPGVGWYLRGPG